MANERRSNRTQLHIQHHSRPSNPQIVEEEDEKLATAFRVCMAEYFGIFWRREQVEADSNLLLTSNSIIVISEFKEMNSIDLRGHGLCALFGYCSSAAYLSVARLLNCITTHKSGACRLTELTTFKIGHGNSKIFTIVCSTRMLRYSMEAYTSLSNNNNSTETQFAAFQANELTMAMSLAPPANNVWSIRARSAN